MRGGSLWDMTMYLPLLEKYGVYSSHRINIADQCKYKYIIDIEGWSASWARLEKIMLSGSVPFKHESLYKQYFESGLEPYVHYIPVKRDFSDIHTQILWVKNNDDKAK